MFQSLLSWKYNQIFPDPEAQFQRPRVSILVILEIQSDLKDINAAMEAITVSILVILEIQSDQVEVAALRLAKLGFNPCYLGNTIRSTNKQYQRWWYVKFQSLLSWKYNQIVPESSIEKCLDSVSILVILEIQSDPNMKEYTVMRIICFNPCYLGNTIRSVWPVKPAVTDYFSFNPCYLGNTIRSWSANLPHWWKKAVSILVILEIQSDPSLSGLHCCERLGFNPCYLGNTIRSRKFALMLEHTTHNSLFSQANFAQNK